MNDGEEVIEQIKHVVKLGPWLKTAFVGAFMLGFWVTTLQVQMLSILERVVALEASKKEREDRFDEWKESITREVVEVKTQVSSMKEDVTDIKRAVTTK